jgi:hypothetical protein
MRTPYQSGAERGHWHDALGVDRSITGEQTIRLLGPFQFAHDSAGLDGTGVVFDEIPAGSLLLEVALFTTEEFGGDAEYVVSVGAEADVSSGTEIGRYHSGSLFVDANGLVSPLWDDGAQVDDVSGRMRIVRATAPNNFFGVSQQAGAFPAPAGEADVYALIAEPA